MSENDQTPDATEHASEGVMGLLSEHVPLSLIVDLSDPEGPDSEAILTNEGVPEDSWWVQPGTEAAEGEADDNGDEDDVTQK